MAKSSKQIALKSVSGLPSTLETLLIEFYNKLNTLKLTVPTGDEVPPIEASSAELIKRSKDNFFDKLTMPQPDILDQTEKVDVKTFYQDYLIPGLGPILHAFKESTNLHNHLTNNHSKALLELLENLTVEINQQYENTRNMQYTQIHALINGTKQQLSNILKIANEQRNK